MKGTCEALGFFSLAADFGMKLQGQVLMDASAAMGIIERRGLAKVRRVDADVLWLQETEVRKKFPLQKVNGNDNPSDLMTKNVDAAKVNKYCVFMTSSSRPGARQRRRTSTHWTTRMAHGIPVVAAAFGSGGMGDGGLSFHTVQN